MYEEGVGKGCIRKGWEIGLWERDVWGRGV